MRTVGHGQADGGGTRGIRTGGRDRLSGKQLRGRTRQTVRVQEIPGPHPENRRLCVPGRQLAGRLPGTVSQLALQMSLVRLRRHRRVRVQAQSSFQGHAGRHTGENDARQGFDTQKG